MMRAMMWRGVCVCLAAFLAVAAARGQGLSVSSEPDGTLKLGNDWIALTVSNRPGQANGIKSWLFKPTNAEMVDVLYGQTDYVRGHLLGEQWDATAFKNAPGGAPPVGSLYATELSGVSKDGLGLVVRQTARGAYALERTLILRRDLLTLEARYRLTNVTGAPLGVSLRFHGAASPGARGKYQSKDETIFLDTDAGLLELDQSLKLPLYMTQYKEDKFFNAWRTQEPARGWVNPAAVKTPLLRQNWAAWVNRKHGDGMVFLFAPENLLGFYNCPGITLEPVMRCFALDKGETWQCTAYIGAFTGARDRKVAGATPLYVAVTPVTVDKGALAGEVIPLFAGRIRIVDAGGKTLFEAAAAPDKAVALKAAVGEGTWRIAAIDRAGVEIGTVDAAGVVSLSDPKVEPKPRVRPTFAGDVYVSPESEKVLSQMVAGRDFVVQCDWSSKEVERDAVRGFTQGLKMVPLWTAPTGKAIVIGNPLNSGTVRDIGILKDSVDADWPGPGRGAVVAYANFESTKQPVLLIAGGDPAGTLRAVQYVREKMLKDVPAPAGFKFWPASTDLKVYPSTPMQPAGDRVRLFAARGEYESAQVVISAFEDLKNVEVTATPLVHAETKKEISKRYDAPYRRRNGPILVRWVNFYPVKPDDGWTGYPDPLLERAESRIAAGRAQGVWLTFIIADDAQPGLYQSTVTCKANGETKTISVEVTVWDFTLPRDGLQGEPYIHMAAFPPDDTRELLERHVRALIENMVEHGMRLIHLNAIDLFRVHLSPKGEYKGRECDWLTVSDDGMVALDTHRLDVLADMVDAAAKPYEVSFMIYNHSLLTGPDEQHTRFKRAFPNRFADKPKREGNWGQDYWSQELQTLLRKHLEARGLMKRVVFKVGDEPPGFDRWWNEQTVSAREAGLPVMTAFNNIDFADAEKGFGTVACWQPLYQLYDAEFFKKARAAGAKISWYNCGPPPKTSVQTGASELRGYLWQAAKADLDVVCWWGIQCWYGHSKMWTNRYEHWNSVVYPPHPEKEPWIKPGKGWVDSAPLDSIRWEHIRDGMEDAWYVNLLRRKIAEARAKNLGEAAEKAQAALDAVWAGTFPTLNDYAPEFSRMLECRAQVAAAILDIQKALKPEKKP